LKSNVTNRKPDGRQKLDPLIRKRNLFQLATADIGAMRNAGSVSLSGAFNFGPAG